MARAGFFRPTVTQGDGAMLALVTDVEWLVEVDYLLFTRWMDSDFWVEDAVFETYENEKRFEVRWRRGGQNVR